MEIGFNLVDSISFYDHLFGFCVPVNSGFHAGSDLYTTLISPLAAAMLIM